MVSIFILFVPYLFILLLLLLFFWSDTGQSTEAMKDSQIVILVNIPRGRYEKTGAYIETTHEAYENYMRYISTCPFIQGLKERGIDVETKVELGCKDLGDATKGGIFATWLYNFQGLEACVVVFLPGDSPREVPAAAEHAGVPRPEIPAPGLKAVREKETEESEALAATCVPAAGRAAARGKEKGVAVEESDVTQPAQSPGVSPKPKGKESGREESEVIQSNPTKASLKPEGNERGTETSDATTQPHPTAASPEPKGTDERLKESDRSHRASPAGAPPTPTRKEATGEDSYVGQSSLYWKEADIKRFSPWDQTNIMIAGSRCLSLLILLVP